MQIVGSDRQRVEAVYAFRVRNLRPRESGLSVLGGDCDSRNRSLLGVSDAPLNVARCLLRVRGRTASVNAQSAIIAAMIFFMPFWPPCELKESPLRAAVTNDSSKPRSSTAVTSGVRKLMKLQ